MSVSIRILALSTVAGMVGCASDPVYQQASDARVAVQVRQRTIATEIANETPDATRENPPTAAVEIAEPVVLASNIGEIEADAVLFRELLVDEVGPDEVGLEPGDEFEAVPASLSLESLEAMAMNGHPVIGRGEARVAALRGKWVQAGLPPNPVAQYNSDEIGNEGSSGLHRMAVGQMFITADKLCLQQAVVAAEIEAARAQLAANRLRVQTDVRAAFQRALVAQQRLELVGQLREIAEKSVHSVEAMVRARESSRIELLQAQTLMQQANLSMETSAASLDGARQRLAAVVGIEQLPPGTLHGDLDAGPEILVYEQLQSELVAASPELASRMAAIDRAQRSLRLAVATITPNVTAQLGVGVDTFTDDTFGSVQVSVPLPIINRNQGNIRKMRSEIAEADRAYEQQRLNLNERLATAFQSYEMARLRKERIRDEIVPRAEETLSLSVQAFEAGEASFLQLLTVQRTLFESRLTLLDATAELSQSATLINGFLLNGSLATN